MNGFSPTDEKYPYYQIFYYITRVKPVGHVKKFIDFIQFVLLPELIGRTPIRTFAKLLSKNDLIRIMQDSICY